MAIRLLPCAACDRHVRIDDPTCPFCGVELGARVAPAVPSTARLSRSARYALGAALAIAGCGGTAQSNNPPPQPAPTEPTAQPPDDGGGVVAEYGAPAPPPEEVDPPQPEDQGGMMPKYGAPPPPKD